MIPSLWRVSSSSYVIKGTHETLTIADRAETLPQHSSPWLTHAALGVICLLLGKCQSYIALAA